MKDLLLNAANFSLLVCDIQHFSQNYESYIFFVAFFSLLV